VHAELVAERAARLGREREEVVELEAERDDLELLARRDAGRTRSSTVAVLTPIRRSLRRAIACSSAR
jgi:hypothetical protein